MRQLLTFLFCPNLPLCNGLPVPSIQSPIIGKSERLNQAFPVTFTRKKADGNENYRVECVKSETSPGQEQFFGVTSIKLNVTFFRL